MALPFQTGFSPLQGEPVMGNPPLAKRDITEATLTTAGGARTATIAELIGGLLVLNVDDAQTLTLPTAALVNAGTPGARIGQTVEFDVINIGDATLTVAVGTGGTLVVGNSKSTVATLVANASKRFILRITGVKHAGAASDSYVVYGFGSTAAATA